MKGSQLIPYSLPDVPWSAGGRATTPLRDLPHKVRGRIAHLAGISWEVDVDPTFTTAPTVVGLNNVVSDLKIHDGVQLRHDGGFNYLRVFEALEFGRLPTPEPDTNSGSTNNFYFTRYWSPGPMRFEGNPSDFAIACSALENAAISYTFGALTDISADTTAATVTLKCTAWLLLLDEVRVGPVYARSAYAANSADFLLAGRALYPYLALLNSASVDAITAGDFGSITVNDGEGEIVSAVDAEVLTRAFHAQMGSGQFTIVQGEPRSGTDDNPVIKNGGTPTALVAATAAIQPVLWTAPGGLISKVVARPDSGLRVRWNGSQASAIILSGRILDQPMTAVATMATKALNKLGLPFRGAKVKTLSKQPYTGRTPEFMPYKVDVLGGK